MSRPIVYLSGPLSKGDRSLNVFQFMQAHELLMDAGFAVYNPGLTAMLPWAWEKKHEDWIASDLPLVEKSDFVLRLPGESVGADMETDHALKHNILVVFVDSIASIKKYAIKRMGELCA